MIGNWPAPSPSARSAEELAVYFDRERDHRLLIVPALFDEANKLRRLTLGIMRELDYAGIDCFLPDLPGCNESQAALESQTLDGWRLAVSAAASHFACNHVVSIRGGAVLDRSDLPGWAYAPTSGTKQLRSMLRARVLASKEAGREETSEQLLAIGGASGLELAGWPLGAKMVDQLHNESQAARSGLVEIVQRDLPGAGLWLRAEPDDHPEQAAAIAAIIAAGMPAR